MATAVMSIWDRASLRKLAIVGEAPSGRAAPRSPVPVTGDVVRRIRGAERRGGPDLARGLWATNITCTNCARVTGSWSRLKKTRPPPGGVSSSR